MGMLADIVIAVCEGLAEDARRKRMSQKELHKSGCTGTHCAYPGHGNFCLHRYKSFVDYSGNYYCNKHFRQKLGLPRR
jgi:hypothetical protein